MTVATVNFPVTLYAVPALPCGFRPQFGVWGVEVFGCKDYIWMAQTLREATNWAEMVPWLRTVRVYATGEDGCIIYSEWDKVAGQWVAWQPAIFSMKDWGNWADLTGSERRGKKSEVHRYESSSEAGQGEGHAKAGETNLAIAGTL